MSFVYDSNHHNDDHHNHNENRPHTATTATTIPTENHEQPTRPCIDAYINIYIYRERGRDI